jgi:hypothetical protein
MNLYNKIEDYVQRYPTKIRVYLSVVFALVIMLNVKDMIDDELFYNVLLIAFTIVPIAIYYFVSWIFPKEQ